MARTWLSVTVEMLGGRGEQLWPYPGRIFAVAPSHTFMDLADAINDAFARWDRSHLSMFTLADGRTVTDEASGAEMAGSIAGPITAPLNIESAKISAMVQPGAEFQYTFDLGDDWIHRCLVGAEKVDPLAELGIRPSAPLAYWGWGAIPDQYGRRWAEDDGEGRAPRRPRRPHPMLLHAWPGREQLPELDMQALRSAVTHEDAAGFLATVTGPEIDDALQQIAAGIPMALEQARKRTEPVALSVINRLTWRAGTGDDVLAADLLAHLRREPPPGRVTPVDLDTLSAVLQAEPAAPSGGYVDLHTGQVHDDAAQAPVTAGQDAVIDVDEEPDRWLRFASTGSRDGWGDMAAFAERQRDAPLRERLELALDGDGAFRQFRDLIHEENLTEQWSVFAADRQLGRARELLAANGVRVG